METGNPQSTVKIAGHPIHPMLIPFPIVLFVSGLVCDLVVWRTGSSGWAAASTWLIGFGLIGAALAALAGVGDFLGDRRIRALGDSWQHMIGNVIAVLIELFNWWRRYSEGQPAIVPLGLILSLVTVLILLFTGWKGWEMVYRDRVGIKDQL